MGQERESRPGLDVLFGVALICFGLWAIAGGFFWQNLPTVAIGAGALLYGFRRTPLPAPDDTAAGHVALSDD